jgi:hypothetical protein
MSPIPLWWDWRSRFLLDFIGITPQVDPIEEKPCADIGAICG